MSVYDKVIVTYKPPKGRPAWCELKGKYLVSLPFLRARLLSTQILFPLYSTTKKKLEENSTENFHKLKTNKSMKKLSD